MALTATLIYWIIVTIWTCVLVCIVSYSRKARTVFGSARVLEAVRKYHLPQQSVY
jgi:hypothetical protein